MLLGAMRTPRLLALVVVVAGCASEAPAPAPEPAPVAVAPVATAVAASARTPTVLDVAPNVEAMRQALARDGVVLPEPLAGAPPTFVRPDDPANPRRACLVRLRRVTLGGEFDAFDDEDLVIHAERRGVRHELGAASLDLPAEGVETFDVEGHEWIEVPMVPDLELVVWVVEKDARRDEMVARSVARFSPSDLPDGTSPIQVPLGTIRGTRWTLLGAGKPFTVEGASVELAALSVRRTGGESAAARNVLLATLGPLVDAAVPRTGAGARTASRMLLDRAAAAMAAARGASDPATRAVVAELAAEVRRLAVLAAAAVLEPLPALARALQRLDEEAGRCGREGERRKALVAGCGLLVREGDMPLEVARVRRAHAQAVELLQQTTALTNDEARRTGAPPDLTRLLQSIGAAEGLLRRTVVGIEARERMDAAWIVVQSRLRLATR